MMRRLFFHLSFVAILAVSLFDAPHTVVAEDVIPADVPSPIHDDFFLGKVTAITDDTLAAEDANISRLLLTVHIQKPTERIEVIPYEYETTEGPPWQIDVGDRIIIGVNSVSGEPTLYVSDVYRLPTLSVMVIFLALFAIVFAGKYGARAFLGLVISFAVIIFGMIPAFLAGKNPLLVSIFGTVGIATFSLFIAHGFRMRTVIAFISTIVTLLGSFFLGGAALRLAHLSGLGSEDAFFLQSFTASPLDLRGLLLGAMIIGVLGVLDDVTTAQTAAVEEISLANATLSRHELLRRGLSVGREHIVSLINTLILAYTGASLPLLLLFSVIEKPLWVLVNSEIIFEEIVRMFVGSMTLMAAVPLTTFIAAWYFASHRTTVVSKELYLHH